MDAEEEILLSVDIKRSGSVREEVVDEEEEILFGVNVGVSAILRKVEGAVINGVVGGKVGVAEGVTGGKVGVAKDVTRL